MRKTVMFLRFAAGVCLLLSSKVSDAQTPNESAPANTPPGRTFTFMVRSVEPNNQTSGLWYRVEGVVLPEGRRFLLDCPNYPPSSETKGGSEEERIRKVKQYEDIEQFRKLALYFEFAASLRKRNGVRETMILYNNIVSTPDDNDLLTRSLGGDHEAAKAWDALQKQRAQFAKERGSWWQEFAECLVINRVENGEDLFSIKVLSSDSRSWKHGTGYEVEAQTEDELLTLACSEGKGRACHSLPPKAYRAIRRQSQGGDLVAFYDADLNPVAIFRILRERSLK